MTELPTLYHRSKGGEIHQWRVWTEGDQVLTEYGRVGGQLTRTPGKRATPKNVGKANSTTGEDQAVAEAKSLHTNKLDRKYRLTLDETEVPLRLPMLATDINKVKIDPDDFVGHVQPKLDGVRCLAQLVDGRVQLTSRMGLPYQVDHIAAALQASLEPNTVLDGELYTPGISCSRTTSLVKRPQPLSLALQYNVYDIPVFCGVEGMVWSERVKWLFDGPLNGIFDPIKVVTSHRVTRWDTAMSLHDQFVTEGYEGAIFRHHSGMYEWGHRSRQLLKIKTFEDGEFRVVGFKEGEGKMEGRVIWVCQNDLTEATFDCIPAGTMDDRASYFNNAAHYIGRLLTVKHQGRTDDQIPRFPVGKLFRDAKDLEGL